MALPVDRVVCAPDACGDAVFNTGALGGVCAMGVLDAAKGD